MEFHRRDLCDGANWVLVATTNGPGKLSVSLVGTTPVSNIGCVAQCNVLLSPQATGALAFTLSDATFNGIPVGHAGGALTIPAIPIIGTLPPSPGLPLWAVGGTPPYTWSVVEDTLPPGLLLDTNTGRITGYTSAIEGEFLFRIRVQDSVGQTAYREFSMATFDTDADLVPDWWEWQHYGSATGCVAAADDDSDGLCNGHEYVAETDPADSASVLQVVQVISPTTGTVNHVTWSSVGDVPYSLGRSTNLLDADGFAVIADGIAGGSEFTTFSDTNPPMASSTFYRIVLDR